MTRSKTMAFLPKCRLFIAVLCAGLAGLLAPPTQAQKYSITELKPHSGGAESNARGISRNGLIAGYANDKSGLTLGTWWTTGSAGNTTGYWTVPPYAVHFNAINQLDRVVGSMRVNVFDCWPTLLTQNAGLMTLPRGDFYQGEALSVADFLEDGYYAIAGRLYMDDSQPTMRTRAALWNKNGDLYLLPTLSGGELLRGNTARSISSIGGTVGGSSAWKDEYTPEQAVLWGAFSGGIIKRLTANSNVANSGVGGCVNDCRDVKYFAGYYYPYDGSSRVACYWPNFSECIEIGTLNAGYDSQALAVRDSRYTTNNRPEIVGASTDPYAPDYHSFYTLAFRWNPVSGMKNLNDLIITGDSWVLRSANDIDRDGRIVGWGERNGQPRGFLLAPIVIKWFGLSPSILNSLQSAQARIQMLDAVPEDTVISIRTSSTAVRAPATVTVPRGQTSVGFTVTAGRVTQGTEVIVTLTLEGETTTARLKVAP